MPVWASIDQIDLYGPDNNYGVGEPGQPMLHEVCVPEPLTALVWSLLGAASWMGMRVVRRRGQFAGGGAARSGWSEENRVAIRSIIERGRSKS